MGNDKYRFEYDPIAALANAGNLMGMELRPCGPNKLCGGYYINGDTHAYRKDKLKVYISRGGVWVTEEGGDTESLPNWLIKYAGAEGFKDAIRMINGQKQGIDWDRKERAHVVPKLIYVPKEALDGASNYDLSRCNLFRWMCGLFPEQRVREVWKMYNVTTDSYGNAVFWYMDKDGHILFDKRILYKEDGHRDKNFHPGRQYRIADGYSGRCYFGDCVPEDGKKTFVMESEKSALLFALHYGRRAVATGGKNNVHEGMENVLLVPDMDARDLWKEKGEVWAWWEKWGLPEGQIPEKADVGDMIVYKHSK